MKKLLPILLILAACARQDPAPATQPDAGTAAGTIAEAPVPPAPATIVEEAPPTTATGATPAPSGPTSTGGSTPSQSNVLIDSVEIGNPLTVSGRARTFENNVALRVRAGDGTLISESFTTATGELGTFSPYRGTLWLTRDPGARVIVEALEYSAKDGSEQSLVRVERPFGVENVDSALYFPDQSCTGVKPYTRPIPKSISMARLLVEALIAGPTQAERNRGAAVPFPRGSRVNSINLKNGVLTVDFNERLQNVGGSCQAQMIRASVTRTLSSLPSVDRVVITAGGSEALALQP